ncbi:MAG: hypothetical protein V1721_06220 [Pseudomonadota bacterium]
MSKTITAVFDTRFEFESALRNLDQAGFSKDQVTMLVTEETRGKHFGIKESSKAEEGAATGAAVGGLVGALSLSLASAGTLLIPGLNLVVSGALIGGLVGLGAGAATGGLIGSLVGLGIPEHEAKLYENAVRKGAILIAVEARDDFRADRVKDILKSANAQSVMPIAA